MKTMTVTKAIKKGYLVKWDGSKDYTAYEEKKKVVIHYKGRPIHNVEVYKDGGDYDCSIVVMNAKGKLDEYLFYNLNAKLKVYI